MQSTISTTFLRPLLKFTHFRAEQCFILFQVCFKIHKYSWHKLSSLPKQADVILEESQNTKNDAKIHQNLPISHLISLQL